MESAYLDLIDIRDQHASDAIIFLHSYDFAIPDGRKACKLGWCFGPWLQPSLHFRGWNNLSDGQVIVKQALLDFNALLTRVADRARQVVLVPTQGTLSVTNDWNDELRPTSVGFGKIADKFLLLF